MARNTSVMGIYPDRITVSDAVSVLQKAGYRPADISVLSSENPGSKDFAHEKYNRALEGAAAGAVMGAVVGAALGWVIATQTVTITGAEPLIAAGPLLAMLIGAGAIGALGWIFGALTGMTKTKYVAQRYAGRIRRGGILLSVHCDSQEWCDRAKKILKDTGARNISSAREAAADYGTSHKPTERAPLTTPLATPLATTTDRGEVRTTRTTEYVAPESRKTEYVGRDSRK
jgi:hypothetical protein